MKQTEHETNAEQIEGDMKQTEQMEGDMKPTENK